MKLYFKHGILIIVILLLSTCYFSEAKTENESKEIKYSDTDISPPVIIFNVSLMTSQNIVQILVYDAESNLTQISFELVDSPNYLNSSENTFNVTWSYVDYSVVTPPLSKETVPAPTLPPPNDEPNTAVANISTDVFVVGIHNEIGVDAENEEGLISSSILSFCDSYECWGRGGGGNVHEEQIMDLEFLLGVPVIYFDLSGYFCTGCLDAWVDPYGATLLLTNTLPSIHVSLTPDLKYYQLHVEALTIDGYWHNSSVILDPDITGSLTGCCDFQDCDIETCPYCDSSPISFISVFAGIIILTIVVSIKRKRKK